MNVWKQGWTPPRKDDVVFKRRQCEWVIPEAVAKHLKYNPNHVPAVQHMVFVSAERVQIWEVTGTNCDYDKRVFAHYTEKEHELSSSIHYSDRQSDHHVHTYTLALLAVDQKEVIQVERQEQGPVISAGLKALRDLHLGIG